MRTVKDVLTNFPGPAGIEQLPAPRYSPPENKPDVRIGLAVESMSRHMTNEGWEIFQGLKYGGYILCGHNIIDTLHGTVINNETDVPTILYKLDPTTVVIQDEREWRGMTTGPGFDQRETFRRTEVLRDKHDIFKVTILKDAHQRPDFHRESAERMGIHAWITYYHPDIVSRFAPYVRKEHLIRTYHSIDSKCIPHYSIDRPYGCLLSGAVGGAYPLRTRMFREAKSLPHTTVLPHPGYHRKGSATPQFLQLLSKYKVAICTSSAFGYVLRKIIEATAAGCAVITDLPKDEVLPLIDNNLCRVHPDMSTADIGGLVHAAIKMYNPEKQAYYAEQAKLYYDFRVQGKKLSVDIESLRRRYNDETR